VKVSPSFVRLISDGYIIL